MAMVKASIRAMRVRVCNNGCDLLNVISLYADDIGSNDLYTKTLCNFQCNFNTKLINGLNNNEKK